MANKHFDKYVRAKTRVAALNVVLGLSLFITLNFLEWDGTSYRRDSDQLAEALRWAILALSAILAYQIYDRQRLVLGLRWFGTDRERKTRLLERKRFARQQRLKERGVHVEVSATRSARDRLPFVSISHIEMPNAKAVLTSRGGRTIPLLLMCFVVPYPYVQGLDGGIPDEIGLFMFLRLAVIIWVIRDESKIYQHREELKHAVAQYSPDGLAPVFGYWMALKALYIKQPARFILVTFLLFWGTFSYMIWILERETNTKGLQSYSMCLLISLNNMLFSWPDDIYFTHQPQSLLGKMACAGAALSGMLILTLLLGIAANTLILTRAEASMLNFVNLRKAKKKEQLAAAILIQFCWRSHRQTTKMVTQEQEAEKQARLLDRQEQKNFGPEEEDDGDFYESLPKNPFRHGPRVEGVKARFRKIWKQDERQYKVGFETRLRDFRHAHRTRMELEPEKEDKEQTPQVVAAVEKVVQQVVRETLSSGDLPLNLAATIENTVSKVLKAREQTTRTTTTTEGKTTS